jgi:phage tail-like protein
MRCTAPEEFQYFVINTLNKWREGRSDSVFISGEGHLSLTPMMKIDLFGETGQATGLAVDSKGDLFIIDAENCHIWKFATECQTLRRLECVERCEGVYTCSDDLRQGWRAKSLFRCGSENGEFKFKEMNVASGGLAFDKETLYVADPFNHRVQSFYLPQFQIRLVLGRQGNCGPVSGSGEGEFNHPKDIVTDSKGNFYVLDYGNRRIQKFNRFGEFLQSFSRPLEKPEGLAIDREDFLYVVDSAKSTVEKFDRKGEWIGTPVKFQEVSKQTQPSAIAVDEKGIIYVGERGEGPNLSIHQFDQSVIRKPGQTARYLGHFGKYSGKCSKIVVDQKGRLYASCGFKGELIFFSGDGQLEKQGTYYSRVFDSTIETCQWHRLALDIQPAEKSAINLLFRASDKEFKLDETDKNLAWQPLFNTPSNSVAVSDALFTKAAGRYLQLKFQLSGDGFHTHKVRQAQIYFQRLSYLRYLPATYQEDEAGRDFLERFLSIFESVSFEIEREIAGVAKYFDPQAVNSEFLEWLSTWLAVLRDNNWSEEKRRELLKKAFPLYKIRGTVRGLQEMIKLFTGGDAVIIEHHRLQTPMVLSANSTLGISTVVGKSFMKRLILEESSRIGEFALIETDEPPEKPFEAGAFDFTILADTSRLKNDAQMQALRRLIEEEKPAHTRYFLRAGGNEMQLGLHALLEVDTKLSKGFETARLGLTSQIGKGTFLGTKFRRRGVIGVRSAITIDAVLH